jgi:hypothetical protein
LQGAIGVRAASAIPAILILVTLGLVLCLAGCRPAAPTAAAGGLDTAQQQQMNEIMAYMKDKDASLESLRDEVRQLRSQEEDPGGAKALAEDVRVAKALASAARKGAADKSAADTQAALDRLVPALMTLRTNLPSARVAQSLERALEVIHSYPAQDAANLASRYLLQATDICLKAPPTLAPTVTKDIESAKGQVDKQDLAGAGNSLLALLKTLAADESLQTAARSVAAGRGANEALTQGAWVVVTAQLDYLDTLLATLQQKAEGAATSVNPEQPAATGSAAPAEPAPAAAAPANELAPAAPVAPVAPAAKPRR